MVAILQDASPHDVLMLCARALAEVAPDCCEAHLDEFKAELLRVLMRAEQDAAEDAEGGNEDGHLRVH